MFSISLSDDMRNVFAYTPVTVPAMRALYNLQMVIPLAFAQTSVEHELFKAYCVRRATSIKAATQSDPSTPFTTVFGSTPNL